MSYLVKQVYLFMNQKIVYYFMREGLIKILYKIYLQLIIVCVVCFKLQNIFEMWLFYYLIYDCFFMKQISEDSI